MAYLTPSEAPDGYICRALYVPNNRELIAVVRGALIELTLEHNWLQFGDITPRQAASYMFTMVDKFLDGIGQCRMIGEIVAYAGIEAPDARFLVCDGSEVSQNAYPDLFACIGAIYGTASTGNFKLPDLRGRTPSGVGVGDGLSPVTLGTMYGEETHTLTEGEIPSHAHEYYPPTFNVDLETPGAPDFQGAGLGLSTMTGYTGGGEAHNTIGPRLGITYLIYAKD